jgi:hypothetical protein
MEVKKCGRCSHSMESGSDEEIFCIANPPVVIVFEGKIISMFPSMMLWGKCDSFIKGKTQKLNKQPPEILEPELKVIK